MTCVNTKEGKGTCGLFTFVYMLLQLAFKLSNADCGILLIRSGTVSLTVALSRLVGQAGRLGGLQLTHGAFPP